MKTTIVRALIISCGLLLLLSPSPPRALAGIPEPGIVLYGVVSDDLSASGTAQPP